MSKTQISPSSKAPRARQLVVVLKNSKYTHQQFKAFNQTVLGLLENADLSGLDPSRTKNVIFFIRTVVRILEVPTHSIPADAYGKVRKSLPLYDLPMQFRFSESNLHKLLNWIDQVVQQKHMTIEAMLDQFFSLKLQQNYDVN
jgi:hypothetical protein